MNILYIGEAGELGATLVNTLSRTGTVTAAFAQKPVFACKCNKIAFDSNIGTAIQEHQIDTVIYLESYGATLRDVQQLLSDVCEHACRLVYIRERSFFRCRENVADAAFCLCEKMANQQNVNILLISASCLYASTRIPRHLAETARQIERRRELTPGGAEEEMCDCLHADDFCAAVDVILHGERHIPFEHIELQSAYPFMLNAFVSKLQHRYGALTMRPYETACSRKAYTPYQSDNWTPTHSFTEELPLLLDQLEERSRSLQKKRRKKSVNFVLKAVTFAVLFALVTMYTQFVAVASELQYVDMRLLFVVAASLFFGKRYGIAAATLCSVSAVVQSLMAGTRWYVLFYHVDNWIPIAVYFVVAILLGMFQSKRRQNHTALD